MIETITTFIIPQIIEEWIAFILIMVIWLCYFVFEHDRCVATHIKISICERVLFVLILTFIMSVISYLSLKIILSIGGMFF